jgi:hypothetical protein
MGRRHLPLSSFEARPTAQARPGSHLRTTAARVSRTTNKQKAGALIAIRPNYYLK